LRLVKDPSEFIHTILQYDFKRAANRIIGAYQFLQEEEMAAKIQAGLEKERIYISPENPFKEEKPLLPNGVRNPSAARIELLWNSYRDVIIQSFDPPSKLADKKTYFAELEKLYTQDAYNSLSIEGYRVDDELIQRVLDARWNPDENSQDQATRNALAALGYHRAFQAVKASIGRILDGASAALEAKNHLHEWMQNLFQPMVDAQILRSQDLIGYRRSQVYIRGSRHIPFARETLLDAMEAFYNCLSQESHPAVRAILGHFLFVYIHPYMDGNGRTARFLMNVCFASGGYSWTTIRVKNRERYFAALEAASTSDDIAPLVKFIQEEMRGMS
jgi:Fic family protein